MILGGPRRFVAITASLLLTGGLVWGCTHEFQTVPPQPIATTTSTNTTPVNVAPVTTNSTPTNTNIKVSDSKTESEVEPVGGNEATEEDELIDPEALARDTERVVRVTQIQQALDAYKVANNAFPEALAMLSEDFLVEIPKDVDGDEFSYTPIGALPAQFYDLCYELEVGTTEITAGYHCASPEGIAHP